VVTGNRAQIDEVHSGSSVMSQGDLRLHFGLGNAQVVDLIEVKWPTTQKIERFTQVKANQILTIREGSGIVEALEIDNEQYGRSNLVTPQQSRVGVPNCICEPDEEQGLSQEQSILR
jgi:ASPIC and UnbV